MPRYRVAGRIEYTMIEVAEVDVDVEADNEEEAARLALLEGMPTGEGTDPVWAQDWPEEIEELA